MRTTITLEDDVAVKLERARERSDDTFKNVVNRALRLGLRAMEEPSSSRTTDYRTPSVSLGGCKLPDVDDIAGVLAIAEGDAFK